MLRTSDRERSLVTMTRASASDWNFVWKKSKKNPRDSERRHRTSGLRKSAAAQMHRRTRDPHGFRPTNGPRKLPCADVAPRRERVKTRPDVNPVRRTRPGGLNAGRASGVDWLFTFVSATVWRGRAFRRSNRRVNEPTGPRRNFTAHAVVAFDFKIRFAVERARGTRLRFAPA